MTLDNSIGSLYKGLNQALYSTGNTTMMALGEIRFGMGTQEYESLATSMSWRWEERLRYMRDPAQQYQGPGSVSKTFKITIIAETGKDLDFLPFIRKVAGNGKPLQLMAGHSRPIGGVTTIAAGSNLGLWVITGLDIDESNYLRDGTALLYDATISIKSYGEDAA